MPAYLSVRYLNRAEERAAVDVDGAFEDLDRARSLNPASLDPDLAEGRIAIAGAPLRRAREQAFEHSLTVEDNWLAHFELALIDASRGRFARAQPPSCAGPAPSTRATPCSPAWAAISPPGGGWIPRRENTRIQRAAHDRFTTSGR